MRFTGKIVTILLVFIMGYVLGVIGLEYIVSRIINEYRELNVIALVGFTASIVTLLLFGTYIIGRYLLIKRMEITLLETIEVSRNGELEGYTVIDEYDLGEETSESIYLMSLDPIIYIRLYEYDFQSDSNGKLIQQHNLLKNGQAIKINSYLPCGIPNYVIEYQRFDYVKGKVVLGENGKNGLIVENLEIRHTVKSIIYYLVK